MHHVHTVQPVPCHGWSHVRRYRTQVFPNDNRLMAVGLKSQYRVKLLSTVAHIGSLAGFHAARNKEQPMQAHYVVNAQNAGMLQVVAQAGD